MLHKLPLDLVNAYFQYCDFRTLYTLSLTCKNIHTVYHNNTIRDTIRTKLSLRITYLITRVRETSPERFYGYSENELITTLPGRKFVLRYLARYEPGSLERGNLYKTYHLVETALGFKLAKFMNYEPSLYFCEDEPEIRKALAYLLTSGTIV